MEYKGRIQLLSTKPQMIYRRILWCWGQKVFCPQLMPTNCSAAKQLPQFYKHSKSADLLRKSLLSTLRFGRCKTNIHWMFCTSCLAGPKFKILIVQARTAFWTFDPGIQSISGVFPKSNCLFCLPAYEAVVGPGCEKVDQAVKSQEDKKGQKHADEKNLLISQIHQK